MTRTTACTVAVFAALAAHAGCGGRVAPSLACATTGVADATFDGPFDIDTGLGSSNVGASYGQPSCPDQYLVELDPTRGALRGHDVTVSGGWSTALPPQPCDESATMRVFTFDGQAWQLFDEVTYSGQGEAGLCHAAVVSHTNRASAALGATLVPASSAFRLVRVSMQATQQHEKLPILLIGHVS